jgi:hypothetical protein
MSKKPKFEPTAKWQREAASKAVALTIRRDETTAVQQEATQETPGKEPHPTLPGRWADGTIAPGGVLRPPAVGVPEVEVINRLGDLDGFQSGLEQDQGGSDLPTIRSGYIKRLTEIEGLCRLLGADLVARGIFTPRGRVRNTFTAFMTAVTTWDKVAQRLGMERRSKDVGDLSINDYIDQQSDRHDHIDSPDQAITSRGSGDARTHQQRDGES